MHDPICLCAFGCFPSIEDKSLLDAHSLLSTFSSNGLISTCSFPLSRTSSPIGPWSIWVFSIPGSEKIPFLLSKQGLLCKQKKEKNRLFIKSWNRSDHTFYNLFRNMGTRIRGEKWKYTWKLPWIIFVEIIYYRNRDHLNRDFLCNIYCMLLCFFQQCIEYTKMKHLKVYNTVLCMGRKYWRVLSVNLHSTKNCISSGVQYL